ncbi:MAG: glycosyltransferase family 4 protein [Muribaculaceae bacterium]
MKICHIVWGLEVGGIETMLVNIANGQVHRGHCVNVLVINDMESAQITSGFVPEVNIIRLHRHPGSKNPMPVFRLNFELMKLHPDVVHFHGLNQPRLVFAPWRKHSVTTLHTICHEEDIRYLPTNQHIAAISHNVAIDLMQRTGRNSTVVLNGIDCSKISLRDDRPFSHPLRMVQVGRLNHTVKGQDIIIRALTEVDDATIDFIGDGPSRADLEQMARQLNVADRVRFLGSRTQAEVFSLLPQYDLLLQPSRIEGFGLTVAEAMAEHLPVAVSNLDPLVEVVDNGRCGHIFAADNPHAAADCIRQINSEGRNPSMITAASQRVLTSYSILSTIIDYERLYQHL